MNLLFILTYLLGNFFSFMRLWNAISYITSKNVWFFFTGEATASVASVRVVQVKESETMSNVRTVIGSNANGTKSQSHSSEFLWFISIFKMAPGAGGFLSLWQNEALGQLSSKMLLVNNFKDHCGIPSTWRKMLKGPIGQTRAFLKLKKISKWNGEFSWLEVTKMVSLKLLNDNLGGFLF